MYWYDSIERVGRGAKRHIYEARTINDRTVYRRVCGTNDHSGGGATVGSKKTLTYVDLHEILSDPNSCDRCLSIKNLDAVNVPSRGADSVAYDPFGVFTEDKDE